MSKLDKEMREEIRRKEADLDALNTKINRFKEDVIKYRKQITDRDVVKGTVGDLIRAVQELDNPSSVLFKSATRFLDDTVKKIDKIQDAIEKFTINPTQYGYENLNRLITRFHEDITDNGKDLAKNLTLESAKSTWEHFVTEISRLAQDISAAWNQLWKKRSTIEADNKSFQGADPKSKLGGQLKESKLYGETLQSLKSGLRDTKQGLKGRVPQDDDDEPAPKRPRPGKR